MGALTDQLKGTRPPPATRMAQSLADYYRGTSREQAQRDQRMGSWLTGGAQVGWDALKGIDDGAPWHNPDPVAAILGTMALPAKGAVGMGEAVYDAIGQGTKSLLQTDPRLMNQSEVMKNAAKESFDLASMAVGGGAALGRAPAGSLGVNAWNKGPNLTKEQYDKFVNSNSKKRRKWGDETRSLYSDMKSINADRYGNRPNDPLLAQRNSREYRANKLKGEKAVAEMHGGLWNRKFADDVILDIKGNWDSTGSINRANMEAVPRQLKKEGWAVRHASIDSSGKKSSRYIISPDGKYEVRISDHELPDTPQRQYSRDQAGGPRWNDEIVLDGNEDPQQIINKIKSMALEKDGVIID